MGCIFLSCAKVSFEMRLYFILVFHFPPYTQGFADFLGCRFWKWRKGPWLYSPNSQSREETAPVDYACFWGRPLEKAKVFPSSLQTGCFLWFWTNHREALAKPSQSELARLEIFWWWPKMTTKEDFLWKSVFVLGYLYHWKLGALVVKYSPALRLCLFKTKYLLIWSKL